MPLDPAANRWHYGTVLRPAQTGDYFIVARPTGDDERALKDIQQRIADELGGEPEPYVHVTLQRFELPESINEAKFLDDLEKAHRVCKSAEVVASTLFSTYHRYFARHSLRWKVEATSDIGRLTLQSAQFIMHQGGTSHWPNAEAPIAQSENQTMAHLQRIVRQRMSLMRC